MIEKEASLLLRGKDDGVSKMLTAVTKSSINLNKEVAQTASSFTDVGESIPHKSLKLFGKTSRNTVGSISKLDRSLRGVGSNYGSLIDKTEKANSVLEVSDNLFVKLSARALGYNDTLNTISNSLGPAAGFWQDYSKASTGASKSLRVLGTVSQALGGTLKNTSGLVLQGADSLREMGGVAAAIADPLESVGKQLGKAQKGLKLASFANTLDKTLENVKEFKEETLPELREQLEDTLETVDKLGIKEKFFGSTFKTLNTTATVLSATTKGLSKNASDAFLAFAKFVEIKGYVTMVASSLFEARRTLNDTYRSVEELQSLGIDTTFQEAALSIGAFGEKLLLSTENAKKFRQQAVAAFAGFQDQLAYLTTLSSAAEIGQQKLGDSILNLVNGPLKNAVSAMDVATGYYDAMSAGQSSMEFMNAAMKFSAATGADAANSIGALAQVHNIYRLNARDATKTAALLNATIENGVINGAEMASGIGQLASVAKSAGIGMNELNAMIAALTKNGFSAADAFQGLMSLITSIAGQGSESAKAAQELGVRFDFARIKAEGLMKPIGELYSAARGSDSRIKTIVPDALAYRTAIALATNASNDFVDVQSKMDGLDTKSLDTVFERRQDSIVQRAQNLRNGFNDEMIRFGNDLQGTITPAIAAGEALLDRFQALPEPVRNLVIAVSKLNVPLEKSQQLFGILGSLLGNVTKAYVAMRVAALGFGAIKGGPHREQLRTIIDLVKNQKDYIGALKVFLGVSDSVAEKVKHLTSIERSQLLQNQKLLGQRKQAIASLSKIESIGGVNFFAQSDRDITKTINKSFKNATPLVKEKANRLRAEIVEQFDDMRQQGGKSNNLLKFLGLENTKDTEADLNNAMVEIQFARENGLENLKVPEAEKRAYLERLDLIENNVEKRRELLELSRNQLDVERRSVTNLQAQMDGASKAVKGTLDQGKDILKDTYKNKGNMMADVRRNTVRQLNDIDDSIGEQVANLSPQFASVLAGKTDAELETAIGQIRENIEDEQIEALADTLAAKKETIASSKEQVEAIKSENQAIKKAIDNRKLDLVERQKVQEAIAGEIDIRNQSIELLQQNEKIDFLKLVGDEEIKEKIQAGFATASDETKEQMGKLAEELQSSSQEIMENDEAVSILEAIGLGDVENNLAQLEGVAEKLEELKESGEPDPEAMELVEQNLEQRQALAAATATETAALRGQNAALGEQAAVLETNNIAKAKQIGFTGPLAAMNVKFTASLYAARDALIQYTAAMNAATGATVRETVATKLAATKKFLLAAKTKLATLASGGFTAATNLAGLALKKLWLTLGPIGLGLAALTAAFVAFGRVRDHLKTLEDSRMALTKLTIASELFTHQLDLSRDMQNFAEDLQEYSEEVKTSAENAEKSGEKVAEAKRKLNQISDLDIEVMTKSGEEFGKLRSLSLDDYIDQLEKTSEMLIEYNSASDVAFDSVTVENMKEQTRAAAKRLRELATEARLAGDAIEAIRLEEFANEAEDMANRTVNINEAFEGMLLEQDKKDGGKRLEAYKKLKQEEIKKRNQAELDVRRKRGEGTGFLGKDDEIMFAEKKDAAANQIKLGINRAVFGAKKQVEKLEEEIQAIENDGLISVTTAPGSDIAVETRAIIAKAKANQEAAALTADEMKKLIELEQEALDIASKISDRDIANKQAALDKQRENKTITEDEADAWQEQIDKMKELATAREEAGKDRIKQIKNAQSAANLIDQNNAGASTEQLLENFNKARIKIIEATTDEVTKASDDYDKQRKKWEEDASAINDLPAEFRTASLDYFDAMAETMQQGMNTTTSYQRRQLSIATNGLAELATNVDIISEKGTEAAQSAIDKAIENAKILQASGALSPEAISQMYDQIEGVSSKIGELGAEGSVALASQLDEIFDGRLANEQEVVNRLVAINKRGIEEIAHLQSMALLDEHQAQKERLSLETRNNELIYRAAQERYNKIAATRGANTRQALDALEELVAAERAYETSKFQEKRAKETRELEKYTAALNEEVGRTVLAYSRELDYLQLITAELSRKDRLINAYNQSLNTSLTFLDDLAKSLSSSIKDERYLAGMREFTAQRSLKILELQQQQEVAAVERSREQNRLKTEEALISNDIAIADKEKEIALAEANHKQDKRNRKLRKDEIEAFKLRRDNMQRELELLDLEETKLLDNFEVEDKIAVENLTQLELKQEQAKNGGVLDIIDAKLSKISSHYQAQQRIITANSDSYNARVGYVDRMLNLAGRVTSDEKQQQRLAQITAQTKLKTLQQQQEFERRTLEIQQQQNLALLKQEKIKLKILAVQQKAAIADDSAKLIEARQSGNEEMAKALEAVLDSRTQIMGTIEASNKSLGEEIALQQSLNAIERDNLRYKQKGDVLEAKIAVNETRPDGNRKERERKRLQREALNSVGLNPTSLNQSTFTAPTAKIPKGFTVSLPDDLDLNKIVGDVSQELMTRMGVSSPFGTEDNSLEREFTQARNSVYGRPKTNILDYVDPSMRSQWQERLGGSVDPTPLPQVQQGLNGIAPTTIPLQEAKKVSEALIPADADKAIQESQSYLDIAKAQLITQQELVKQLQQFNENKGDMYNEIAINVADADTGAEEIESIFLNKFDQILSEAEAK